MISCLQTPSGDLRNQLQRNRLCIWKLYSSFAGLITSQTFLKYNYRFGSCIQPKVFFVGSKVDDVVPFPIGRHTPRNPFFGFRDRCPNGVSYSYDVRFYIFRLNCDIFIYGFGLFTTIMGLVFVFKRTSTLGTFPHGISLPVLYFPFLVYHKTGQSYSPNNSLTILSLIRTAPTKTKRLKMSSPT